MSNNTSHSFNIDHVKHMGLTSSVIYQQLKIATSLSSNHTIKTSLHRLQQSMPYYNEGEILESLNRLNDLTIIAFEFTDFSVGQMRLVSLNDPIDVFDIEG